VCGRRGKPAATVRPAAQRYPGSDRELPCRLLGILREGLRPGTGGPPGRGLARPGAAARALRALVADGLATALEHQMYALPAIPPSGQRSLICLTRPPDVMNPAAAHLGW